MFWMVYIGTVVNYYGPPQVRQLCKPNGGHHHTPEVLPKVKKYDKIK